MRITRQLQHYSYQDPPSKREKAISLGLVIQAAAAAESTPFEECQADLIQIAPSSV